MQKKISTSLVASLLLATTNLFSAQSLEPITVTSATKSTQSIKDVTSNIEVITKEEIEEKHFTTVTQALNTLSGVSVVSNGGLGNLSSVFVRGMDSKRVLVLIDGIRYNDVTGTSGAPFEHLMIDDIEQIEVVKGAQSGIWGADASAGVINIITKSSKVGTHGNATVEYGSFNSKKYGMNISHKTEKYYVNGSAYETDTDGYSAQAPRYTKVADLEDDGYKNLTANLKAGYNFNDSNKIDLSHTLIDARSEYDGCGNEKWKTSFGGYYSCSDTILQKANNSSYFSKTKDTFDSVNYNNINSFSKIDVYANSSKFNREYNDTQKYTGGVDNGKTLSSKNEFDGTVKELGFKTDIPYQNDNAFIILGTDYKTFEHENDINEQYNNKAIFVTNSNKFNNGKTIITESLRKDAYDKFDDKTTGKVGIKQYVWNELNVSSNYGTAYNVPTLYNLFSNYGNKDLNPEKTKGYDFGVEYLGLSATYFNTKIDDMIDYDLNISKYANIEGTSNLKGYELAYKKAVIEDIFLNLNYTALDAEDSKGQDLARRAKEQVGLGVDYYGIDKFQFNVNGQYIGDRYNSLNKTGVETGNYTVWNSVINYEINKTFSTYLKVDNLFNKYYQTVDGYATAERSAYAGLKASF